MFSEKKSVSLMVGLFVATLLSSDLLKRGETPSVKDFLRLPGSNLHKTRGKPSKFLAVILK